MMERNSSECLLKKLDEEIVLLDGAMGLKQNLRFSQNSFIFLQKENRRPAIFP